jgi:hypothetical protein
VGERLQAARHYRELFSGLDSIEADAAAMRIQTMVERVNAFIEGYGQQSSGGGGRGRR